MPIRFGRRVGDPHGAFSLAPQAFNGGLGDAKSFRESFDDLHGFDLAQLGAQCRLDQLFRAWNVVLVQHRNGRFNFRYGRRRSRRRAFISPALRKVATR